MNFSQMSLSEMIALNKELCEAIRARQTAEAVTKIVNFTVGEKVKYKGSARVAPFIGTVMKILRVNIDVLGPGNKIWRINASQLSKV